MSNSNQKSASPSEPRKMPMPKPESSREHVIWNQGRLEGLAEGIRTERRKWTAEPRREVPSASDIKTFKKAIRNFGRCFACEWHKGHAAHCPAKKLLDYVEWAARASAAPLSHDLRNCPAMRALESLTPGGSEYIDDIPRCVETVRESRQSIMNALVREKRLRNAAFQPPPSAGQLDDKCPKCKRPKKLHIPDAGKLACPVQSMDESVPIQYWEPSAVSEGESNGL